MRWAFGRGSCINYRGQTAFLINTMDITRLKELEHLIIVENKMLSLGRVAAGVAHEIRNPLTGINSYLYSLEKIIESNIHSTDEPALVKNVIKQIQTASNKIESVIKRVMDFAKPGMARMSLVNINTAISEVLTLSKVTARKNGVSIETDLSSNLPDCYADFQLMELVILNLINNAIQAVSKTENGKKIRVSSREHRGRIYVEVADSGPGVPDTMRSTIFDPFFTTKDDGAGIGLNIAQRIITDHKGNIQLETSDLGGALFTLELPIDRRN